MDRLRWLELCIMIGIICLQIYAYIFVFPVEKHLYEECNLKILCLYGKIDAPECEIYKNILPVVVNQSIIIINQSVITIPS